MSLARLQEMKNATGKIPRLRLGMTHSVISNECERSFFSSIFEGGQEGHEGKRRNIQISVSELRALRASFENWVGEGLHAALAIGESSTACPSSWSLQTW